MVSENNEVQIGDAIFETLNLRSKYEGWRQKNI